MLVAGPDSHAWADRHKLMAWMVVLFCNRHEMVIKQQLNYPNIKSVLSSFKVVSLM